MSEWTHKDGVDGIKKQAQELIEQAYHRGFKAGREDRQDWEKNQADRLIEKGRNEAWEAAKYCMNADEAREYNYAFDGCIAKEILENYTASEAIEKIKAYEEQKKQEKEETSDLHIGDEVTFLTIGGEIITGVITGEYHDTHEFRVMRATDGGECYCFKAKRTGRTFPEIAEVLKKMKESE